MKRNILFLFVLLAALTAEAQSPESNTADIFAGARWIAMEADSTILFPHIHLLKANSEQARSLKPYRMPVLSKEVKLRKAKVRRAWADICGLGQYELFINSCLCKCLHKMHLPRSSAT